MKSYRALTAVEPGLDTGVGKQVMTWARVIPGDEQASPSAHVCPGPSASRHQKWPRPRTAAVQSSRGAEDDSPVQEQDCDDG